MREDVALELKTAAERNAQQLSHKQEQFEVYEIIPLAEDSAAVVYLKSGGKKAVAFFCYYWKTKQWFYIMPTDGHILGMMEFPKHKFAVEIENFAKKID